MHWFAGAVADKVARTTKRIIGERIAARELTGAATEAAPLIAVISRSAATLDKTLKRPLFTDLAAGSDMRGLLESGGTPNFPVDREHGSIYMCRAYGVFDQVILDDTMSPIVSPWSRTFYTHLYRLVRPGGRLILPVWRGADSRIFGRWTMRDFADHFGLAPEGLVAADFAIVPRGHVAAKNCASIVGWFIENAPAVLLQHAYLSATKADTQLDCSGAHLAAEEGPSQEDGIAPLAKRLEAFTAQHCYYVGGISYKAPLLSHIIRTHVKTTAGARAIDMGGGYGLLAAELALDPKLKLACSVCTDISDLNARLAAGLYADLSPQLAGRFSFACQSAQDYVYDDSFDVVSFVGSLLYVPKDQLDATLARAWDAVAPGGVLIVHENIKHPRFERDYDLMFTVDEIDNLLGQFGEIHRYASQYTQQLTKQQTGDKTVFRVVQKRR